MCQENEDEGEYLGEIPESDPCFLCGDEDVHSSDRWNFQLENEDGTDVENFWICRGCHARFETVEQFDKFRRHWMNTRLYNAAATLQRMLTKEAPECLIAQQIKILFVHAIRDKGELGSTFLQELKRTT